METKLFGNDPEFVDLSDVDSVNEAHDKFLDVDNYELETEPVEEDRWSYKHDCHYTETTGYDTYITGITENDTLPCVFLFADDSNEYYTEDRPLTRKNIEEDLVEFLDLPKMLEDYDREIELSIHFIVTAWEWVGSCLMVRVWWTISP